MKPGWSVFGKRLELGAAWPAGKLMMDGVLVTKLKSQGQFPVEIEGRAYSLRRKPSWPSPRTELLAPGGASVPLSKTHTPRTLAPAASSCATHPTTPAAIVCARCGSFACDACSDIDGTHCASCIAPMIAAHARQQADLVLLLPVFLFVVSAGALGALLGMGAGMLAVRIAGKLESKLLKWLVALGLYTLALVLFFLFAVLLRLPHVRR